MAQHPLSPLGARPGFAAKLRQPQPVCIEIPVAIKGLAGGDEKSESGNPCSSFYEESQTQLVFPRGAVVRLSANAQPGQRVLLKNRRVGKEILCRVVFSKNFAHTKGYVELEFTQTASGFWGIHFPDEPIGPAAAADSTSGSVLKPVEKPPSPRPMANVPYLSAASAPGASSATPGAVVAPPKPKSVPSPVVTRPERVATVPLADAIGSDTPIVPLPVMQAPRSSAPSAPIAEFPLIVADSAAAGKTLLPAAASAPARSAPAFAHTLLFEEKRSRRRVPPLLAGAVCVVLIGGASIYSLVAMWKNAQRDLQRDPVAASLSAPASASANASLGVAEATAEAPIRIDSEADAAKSSAPGDLSTSNTVPATRPDASPSEAAEIAPRHRKLVLPLQSARIPTASAPQAPAEAPPDVAGALTAGPEDTSSKLREMGLNAPRLAPPPAAEPTKTSATGGKVEQPRLLASVRPVYPLLALRLRIEGDVVIRAQIDETGKVSEMQVVSGPAQLREAAKEALRQWKYAPARLNGQAVAMQLLVTVRFHLP